MVCTIDGKILSGERNEGVMDLGSDVDHQALRDLESQSDAVLIGGETLRSTEGIWYPDRLWKIVLTQTGNLPWTSRFFSDDPSRAIVASPAKTRLSLPDGVRRIDLAPNFTFRELLNNLHEQFGIMKLVVEGGSETNASFLKEDLIDELFLTISPSIKLGRETPTIAGGEPLPREALLKFKLIQNQTVGDEVFLRYRRNRI
jgi:riboflavin biosynthesis pyrimidine reductase